MAVAPRLPAAWALPMVPCPMSTRPLAALIFLAGAAALAAALAAACDSRVTLGDEGPAVPAKLAFSLEPENSLAGQPIAPGIAVTVLDNFGDTAFSSAATIRVSIALGTGNAAAHLSGATQVAATNGTASFFNLSIDSAGTGYRLLASADNLGSALSDSFTVAHP